VNKKGYIDDNLPAILQRLNLDKVTWLDELNQFKISGRKSHWYHRKTQAICQKY